MKLFVENNEAIPAVILTEGANPYPATMTERTTELLYWRDYAYPKCKDYQQFRDYVAAAAATKTWAAMSDEEKRFLCDWYIRPTGTDKPTDSANKVAFLMGTGLSQAQAVEVLQDAFAKWHVEEINSCVARVNSEKFYKIIATYLSTVDAADFAEVGQNSYIKYFTQAIRGVNDSDTGEGLFDFIESTAGTSFEFAGLAQQGYTMQNGDPDMTNFITDLMDVLRNGNY